MTRGRSTSSCGSSGENVISIMYSDKKLKFEGFEEFEGFEGFEEFEGFEGFKKFEGFKGFEEF
jgi:hypothetical protein